MKHYHVLVTLVFVLVACSQAAPPGAAGPSPPPIQPDAVVATAKPYLDWFRQNRDGTSADFGFKDLQELDSATVGTPIEAYDLTAQAVEGLGLIPVKARSADLDDKAHRDKL